jgi:lipoprotein-anchoring transpeptidase ErfK/SrfK
MCQQRTRPTRLQRINQTVEVAANTRRIGGRGGRECENESAESMMRRILVPSSLASFVPICAAVIVIASTGGAASQGLDPGWQLAYPGQPGYGGDGFFQSMFGDGTGLPVTGRAYQAAPTYHQPAQPPRPYQGGAGYYRQVQPMPQQVQQATTAQQAPIFQPQLYYFRGAAGPQPRLVQQPAPAASQQLPPAAAAPAAPGYRGEAMSAPAAATSQYAVPQYTAAPTPQLRGFAAPPASFQPRPASANDQAAPIPPSYQAPPPAPASDQTPPAPPRGLFQPAAQYPEAPQPSPRMAFGIGIAPPQDYAYPQPGYAAPYGGNVGQPRVDPKYDRQLVDYAGDEKPGTIIIDTPNFFLYLVLDGGRAIRYGIGVGRPGFTWAGVKKISAMREWPDWYPPVEMLARRPDLPRYMPGGPDNPLGARALYLGSTLYRIHGSNEPWSIGTQVSSGCIRLRNADIVDLYSRVKVGAKVIVI